jgi:hypothetical protein
METLYELVLTGEDDKLVATDEPVDIGDAVAIDNEVWLVLREADRAATRGRARYECRRGVRLRIEAQELVEHAKTLELQIKEAREARPT